MIRKMGFIRTCTLLLLCVLGTFLSVLTPYVRQVKAAGTFGRSDLDYQVNFVADPKYGKAAGTHSLAYAEGVTRLIMEAFTVDGKAAFCVEPTISAHADGSSLEGPKEEMGYPQQPSPQEKHRMELVAFYAWQRSPQGKRERAYTQLMIWECCGISLQRVCHNHVWDWDAVTADYRNYRASVYQKIADHEKELPWNGKTFVLEPGGELELENPSGPSADLRALEGIEGFHIQYDPRAERIRIKAESSARDKSIVFTRRDPADIGPTLFYTDPVYQDQIVLADSAPRAASVTIRIRRRSPLAVDKIDILSGLSGGTPAAGELAGAAYAVICRGLDKPELADYGVGDTVGHFVTDAEGHFETQPLDLGLYDIVEESAPKNYEINPALLRVRLTARPAAAASPEDLTVLALVEKGNISPLVQEVNDLIAASNAAYRLNGAAREALEPCPNPETTVCAGKSGVLSSPSPVVPRVQTGERQRLARLEIVKFREDPSGDSGPREAEAEINFEILNAAGHRVDQLRSNADGYASSKLLPAPADYILRQLPDPDSSWEALPDTPFHLEEDGQVKRLILEDKAKSFFLKLVKRDAESGRRIPLPNLRFCLLDAAGERIRQIVRYPEKHEIDEFLTQEDGEVSLPEALTPGVYTVVELEGPDGYYRPESPLRFTFTVRASDAPATTEEWQITVDIPNEALKGQLELCKSGDLFMGWEKDDMGVYRPLFREGPLGGVHFRLLAEEDIRGADGSLHYAKADVVCELISDAEQPVRSPELPLGRYRLVETQSPDGYTPAEDQIIELRADDPTKRVTLHQAACFNAVQSTRFSFQKHFEASAYFQHEEEAAKTCQFGLYTAQALIIGGHTLPKDHLVGLSGLEKAEADAEQGEGTAGKEKAPQASPQMYTVSFDGLLPGSYYVRELNSGPAYQKTEDFPIEIRYKADAGAVHTQVREEALENQLLRGSLLLVKRSRHRHERLNGARFVLYAVDEAEQKMEVGHYTSDEKGEIHIPGLELGRYLLQEENAPEHYFLDPKGHPFVLSGDNCRPQMTLENEAVPTLRTQACFADGKKTAPASGELNVLDLLHYKDLIPGENYHLRGRLVLLQRDKAGGTSAERILAEAERSFRPASPDGELELHFPLDASELAGRSLVVCEYLYRADGQLLASHDDLNDENQRVEIESPAPPPIPQAGERGHLARGLGSALLSAAFLAAAFRRLQKKRRPRSF